MNELLEPRDDTSIREKMLNDIGEVPWSYLAPHSQLGSLFFVDPELRLDDVGIAIALNDKDRVQRWISSGDLMRIEEIHTRQWQDGLTLFEALVVMPFILCRPTLKRKSVETV